MKEKVLIFVILFFGFLLLTMGCIEKKSVDERECSFDIECAEEQSKCADGIDPFHFCENNKCITRLFEDDPCLEHICPKGNWHQKTEDSCFRWENCAKKGCDDNSDTTIDECVNVGTRSESCLYTLVNRCNLKPDGGPCKAYFKRYYFDSNEGLCKEFIYGGCNGVVPFETLEECQKACEKRYFCEEDFDCVAEQCCHPTSCVNKNFAPNCEGIFCTMSCEGPIDCGTGKCSCKNNKCVVEKIDNAAV